MFTMVYSSMLLFVLAILTFTSYVLWRMLKIEKTHREYVKDCIRLSKSLDDERMKLHSMCLDAKAEGRAYRMRREKLEQYLQEGFAKFILPADNIPGSLYLDPGETDMLYKLLSKLSDKQPVA
ncbi:MAG: hypothetical protein JNL13_03735 [Chitinophagaceae bacterium]|nr:hypothetical protein [Chitinophagaceae bacterium]